MLRRRPPGAVPRRPSTPHRLASADDGAKSRSSWCAGATMSRRSRASAPWNSVPVPGAGVDSEHSGPGSSGSPRSSSRTSGTTPAAAHARTRFRPVYQLAARDDDRLAQAVDAHVLDQLVELAAGHDREHRRRMTRYRLPPISTSSSCASCSESISPHSRNSLTAERPEGPNVPHTLVGPAGSGRPGSSRFERPGRAGRLCRPARETDHHRRPGPRVEHGSSPTLPASPLVLTRISSPPLNSAGAAKMPNTRRPAMVVVSICAPLPASTRGVEQALPCNPSSFHGEGPSPSPTHRMLTRAGRTGPASDAGRAVSDPSARGPRAGLPARRFGGVPPPSSPCSRRARSRGWLARTVVPSAPGAGWTAPAPNAGYAGGADAAHGRTWKGGPASIPRP